MYEKISKDIEGHSHDLIDIYPRKPYGRTEENHANL
jgi:hypothetical protein